MSAPAAPVAIGTRGTIGSLVKKEIEYFTKFDLDNEGLHISLISHTRGHGSTTFRTSFWVLLMIGRRGSEEAQMGSSQECVLFHKWQKAIFQ
ncbi:uncharacterized protein DS421_11g344620 [Arachis hypogaea]|nr:uncharacterized protein DS421_11g344620 [Arachis hypogaea]